MKAARTTLTSPVGRENRPRHDGGGAGYRLRRAALLVGGLLLAGQLLPAARGHAQHVPQGADCDFPQEHGANSRQMSRSQAARLVLQKSEGPSRRADSGEAERVDIQEASEAELQTLPGIGAQRAQAIVTTRSRRAFRRSQDIMRVPGIGRGLYRRIRDRITVAAPAAPPERRARQRRRTRERH